MKILIPKPFDCLGGLENRSLSAVRIFSYLNVNAYNYAYLRAIKLMLIGLPSQT